MAVHPATPNQSLLWMKIPIKILATLFRNWQTYSKTYLKILETKDCPTYLQKEDQRNGIFASLFKTVYTVTRNQT